MALVAQAAYPPLFHKIIVGVLVHDLGPTSDRHESGIDPHAELQFRQPSWKIWKKIGNPYPTLGITPNLQGDTSAAYAGLTYEFALPHDFFASGGIGIAIHDGPLHKDWFNCGRDSDCGFGHRILPHFSAEIGYKLHEKQAIGIFYDHMSHKHILPGENEGIDHIGLRYHYIF